MINITLYTFAITLALSLSFGEEQEAATVWKSEPPKDCPFEESEEIVGLAFTGRVKTYTKADTWYPSWASDGHLYSPWTDGSIEGEKCHSGTKETNGREKSSTGQARIEGNNPMNLKVVSLGTCRGSPAPYKGRYPCGSLVHNGIWYYGTYGLRRAGYRGNWPILGPCPGFRISRDFGKTWEETPHTCEPGKALFPEPETLDGPVKIGAPHFVDFGKNMVHSPDGKAYLIGHGSEEEDLEDRKANLSWITGDQIYLCRVKPTPQNINDESKYEYFAGHDESGNAVWTPDYTAIKPLIDWDNNCGCVTMTYNAPLRKYLMCVTDGWPTMKTMNTYILESEKLTGPWKLVTYMKNFGVQAYFVNFPSKFISQNGRTAWLCYSGNFTRNQKTNPPGGAYAMTLQEVKLIQKRKANKSMNADAQLPRGY